jgi:hypothetical protein
MLFLKPKLHFVSPMGGPVDQSLWSAKQCVPSARLREGAGEEGVAFTAGKKL